jgi:hypothetical protein
MPSAAPSSRRCVSHELIDFGNSVYGVEDGPKNGSFAPSFHTINHILYHTSLDTPEMVPAEGQQRATVRSPRSSTRPTR